MGELVFNYDLQVWEGTAPNGLIVRVTPDALYTAWQAADATFCASHETTMSAMWGTPLEDLFWLTYDARCRPPCTVAYWLERAG